MRRFVQNMVDLLEKNENFALATIIGLRGSAPRHIGAHMIVCRDGKRIGTIGGGIIEAYVSEQAQEVLIEGKKRIINFNLNSDQLGEMDVICGGQVEVLIEYINTRQQVYPDIYQTILYGLNKGQRVWQIHSLSDNESQSAPCLVRDNAEVIGKEPVDIRILFPHLKNISTFTILEDLQLIVEPFFDSETAYVFGAGHIAHRLVPLLNMVGFRTVVFDDRSEYANQERFPDADLIIVNDMREAFSELKIDKQSYIVIITRGHIYDKIVLAQALKKPAAYIGMIGSKKKRDTIYKVLHQEGYSIQELQQVYSPIGLEIQAESPEEIAISIAAEMIKIRAEKRSLV